MSPIYFDYLNGAPLMPEALDGMIPYFKEHCGNPQSLHTEGREGKEAIEEARSEVARLVGADPAEIYFTSSGTEGNNWIIQGVAAAYRKRGNHIITSETEHPSVVNPLREFESAGGAVSRVMVDRDGRVDPSEIEKNIQGSTILISVHLAQSEIGTIQPASEIGEIAEKSGIPFHADAVPAIGLIPVDVKELRIDYLTLSAQPVCGPKGVGAVYVRKGKKIRPLLYGGNQENGKRPGLENVPGIVGFGIAAQISRRNGKAVSDRIRHLRDDLIVRMEKSVPGARLTGDRIRRLPNHASFRIEGIDGESLVYLLSSKGLLVSTGSSCLTGQLSTSRALTAIGFGAREAREGLVMTLGPYSTSEEVERAVQLVEESVEEMKALRI